MSAPEKSPGGADKSWRSTLSATPVRNEAAKTRRDDAGYLYVTVAREKPWYLFPPLSWIVRPRLSVTYTLDRLGAEVWDLCDGRRTVEQIVEEFAAAHRLTFHEGRASVTGYMKELVRRGAIAIAM